MAKHNDSKKISIALGLIAFIFTILSLYLNDAYYNSSFGFFSGSASYYYWGMVYHIGSLSETTYWWSSNTSFSSDTINYFVGSFATTLLTLFVSIGAVLLIIFGFNKGAKTSLIIGGLGAIGTSILFYQGMESIFTNSSNIANVSFSIGIGYIFTIGALITCFASAAVLK